jgi:hypothetical protein
LSAFDYIIRSSDEEMDAVQGEAIAA